MTGAITEHIDVAQVVLYAFWLFFAGLVLYLRREDRREGYPLVTTAGESVNANSIQLPGLKIFHLLHGGTAENPNRKPQPVLALRAVEPWTGAPFEPTGDPMLDGVGPASWVQRADVPDMTFDNHIKIVPLRVATDYRVEERDPDPRGMNVYGGDEVLAGVVRDVWVDRSEVMVRYLEVDVASPLLPDGETRRVLVPITAANVSRWTRKVDVGSIYAKHFSKVPLTKNPDQVTLLEEDKIMAYYAGGRLYADPSRLGPVI